MSDLISRKAAIDAIKSYWKNEVDRIPKKSTDFDVFTQIIDSILSHNANICMVIDKLPSAQPERGLWIKMNGERGYECSKCGWESDITWDFCPNCGALNIDVWENTDEVSE